MNQGDKHNPEREDLERLYRQAADAEPDGQVDEAVLARAREAASARRPRPWAHFGPWGVGIAAAASIVLAVGLVYRIGLQPQPASPQMQEFRAKSRPEPAGEAPSREAGTLNEADSADEPAGLRKSEAQDRARVMGVRMRQGEAEQKAAAPPPEAEDGASPADPMEQLSPEAWLERIRGQVHQGRFEEAREELRQFQEKYPSAEIPLGIRNALASEPD